MAEWFSSGTRVAQVAISDRSLQYGDGLFETIAIRGAEPRLWQYHMDRLARGCKILGIEMPSVTELIDGVYDALQQSHALTAYSIAKIIVSAGTATRGFGRAPVVSPTVLYGVFSASPPPVDSYCDGINIALCRTRLALDSPTAGIKTLNRLEQVLARSEFNNSGEFEGLTMSADGNIICGTMSNVFFVKNDGISTPSLDRCGVEGVMRRHIIVSLAEQGIDTTIQTVKLSDMEEFDEVFISNSQFGLIPVRSCASMHWPVGKTTRKIMSILADNGVSECR